MAVESRKRTNNGLPAAALMILLLCWGCSTTDTVSSGTGSIEVAETTSPPEVTLGTERGDPEVTLRVEGDRGTSFSGICSIEGEESVISGRVPKRFDYDLRGRKISCKIQKQNPNNGGLRVILLAGDTTRSVQQTNSPNGTINVSYAGD